MHRRKVKTWFEKEFGFVENNMASSVETMAKVRDQMIYDETAYELHSKVNNKVREENTFILIHIL